MKILLVLLMAMFVITGCAQKQIKTMRYDADVSIVKFNFDKSELKDAFVVLLKAELTLDEFIHKNDHMYGRDNYKVGVVGRTDFKADEHYNEHLGMKRAKAVAHYLTDQGVNVFLVQSAGETDDVVTAPYRAENFPGVEFRETNRSVTLITLH